MWRTGLHPRVRDDQGEGRCDRPASACGQATAVYIATDPDREGEAIAWHIAKEINTDSPIYRVLFHEITERGIEQAM